MPLRQRAVAVCIMISGVKILETPLSGLDTEIQPRPTTTGLFSTVYRLPIAVALFAHRSIVILPQKAESHARPSPVRPHRHPSRTSRSSMVWTHVSHRLCVIHTAGTLSHQAKSARGIYHQHARRHAVLW